MLSDVLQIYIRSRLRSARTFRRGKIRMEVILACWGRVGGGLGGEGVGVGVKFAYARFTLE